MKVKIASIWGLSYVLAVVGLMLFNSGLPDSILLWSTIFLSGIVAGLYGIFSTEVTRFVFPIHPWQTTIYTAMISGFALTAITLIIWLVFVLLALKEIPPLESLVPAAVGILFYAASLLMPVGMIASAVALPVSQLLSNRSSQ